MIRCRDCNQPFPIAEFPHRCPICGGLFGFKEGLKFDPRDVDPHLPGIWRYRSGFSLPDQAPLITLGEGNTPLVWTEAFGKQVGFKLESLNPTGSFKDRGSAVLLSWLLAAGIKEAVEDSSGNAGASFAAYASRAGVAGKIFIPDSASGPKRSQIESYGSQVIPVPGARSKAAEAVLQEVDQGTVYASHAYLPHGTAGVATIAYELMDDLGGAPGTVLIPVGHGSLLLGIWLGFKALVRSGVIPHLPRIVGIQAAAIAPLFQAFQAGDEDHSIHPEGRTLAAGVAIADPFHGAQVLAAVRESEGVLLQVEEDRIKSAHRSLAEQGIYAELTSGLVWDGLRQLPETMPDPVVCVISGHGLKSA